MKANKGEWSEFYAFLKIIEEKKLFAADKNLNIIADKFFIFHKMIREEKENKTKIYDLSKNKKEIFITDKNGRLLKKFEDKNLGKKTVKIFEKIKEGKQTFNIPEASALMRDLLCKQLKASNDKKADIVAIIHDHVSSTMPELGFSVKSMVGGSSTLLNAGKTTNFVFEVKGFNGDIQKTNAINTKSKIQDRIKEIKNKNGKFEFKKVLSETFASNLRKVDTVFAEFIAYMILDFFSHKINTVQDLTKRLYQDKEMKEKYGLSLSDYKYKMKNFLDSTALGMVPSKHWDGTTQAHGGYIVVKENGQVVCYHLYNRDEFHSYLYENTKFESASSTRHDYGKIYKKNGKLFFNLNLQIRFLK